MSGISSVKAVLGTTAYYVSLSDDQGNQWHADEPLDVGGGNTGPAPDRLLLGSLGACTAITLQMVASRKKIPLTGIEIELALNPDGRPENGNDITRVIHLQGNLSNEEREQLLKIANACPVHKLLTGEVRIATRIAASAAEAS